jgi:Ca2+/H+ antiporter, TMEM165/GDT1 family
MSILVIVATFLAAAVEWVEALTIVLAVGTVKGWRSAFAGMGAGLLVLVALVAVFGLSLTAYVPIAALRTMIGAFLLLFGLKWLLKAILRSSGLKSLHDEAKAYAETRAHLLAESRQGTMATDWIGVGTSFNGVLLEGLEVVFIVIALGGLNSVPAAITGALASLVVVVGLGIAFRSPLTRIPENAMKYVVGIMLTAFGSFFVGEGIGVTWWRADLSLLPLIATYGIASLLLVQLLKMPSRSAARDSRAVRLARAVWAETWGLFVDDGALATIAVATVLGVALYVEHIYHAQFAATFLVAGVLAAIVVALAGARREHNKVVETEALAGQVTARVAQPADPTRLRA